MSTLSTDPSSPALPKFVADFRRDYRATEVSKRYSGILHFSFTALSSLAIIVCSIVRVDHPTLRELCAVPVVFVYINLAEYLGHRWPMHHRTRFLEIIFHRHTVQHHHFFTHEAMAFEGTRDFKIMLFPPSLILFFGLGFVLPAGLLLAQVFSANVAYLFVATVFGYFLNYEMLHFAYHCSESSWIGRRHLIVRLRKLHTFHHDPRLMTRYNFNITYPIADWVFKTLHIRD